MNDTNITARTITTKQIRALHMESLAAGDIEQARICETALAGVDTAAEIESARAACAAAINAARAMED